MKTRPSVCLLLLAVLGAASVSAAVTEKVRSGYTGWFFGNDTGHVERMIDLLATNGMNAIDVKIQTSAKTYDLESNKEAVKALVERAHSRGLAFNVYLYPFPSSPGRDAMPCDDAAMWKRIFAHAYQWARMHGEIGFDSLRFDIETVNCYEALDEAKLRRIRTAVSSFAEDLHRLAPKMPLGYMPADHHPFSWAFDRALATDKMPAYLDAWDLYNGGGYVDDVGRRAAAARKAHPNNRFVAWLRPNSYRPSDIAVSAYHTLRNTDGYSMWSLMMLDEALRGRRNKMMSLPAETVESDYWQEFAKANSAWRTGEEIPYRKVAAVVPPLDFASIEFPSSESVPLAACGRRSLVLRDPQIVYVRAKGGDELRMSVAHSAGSRRPVAVHYAVLGPGGAVLRDEAVSPGAKESFAVAASADGLYALMCSGGESGQAWYRVAIEGREWCVDARRKSVYLFGPQKFRVPGADRGNPELLIRNRTSQAYRWRVNGGEWHDAVGVVKNLVKLPSGMASVEIAELKKAGYYCQDFFVSLPGGKSPFIYPSDTQKGKRK